MKIKQICCLLLILPLWWGCNKKYIEPVFELSEPEYQIDASTPAGQRALDYYERTGTFILYEGLQPRDFGWDFNVIMVMGPEIQEIPTTELESVLDFLDAHLFSYYSDAFMRDLFPYRIPLAEAVTVGTTRYNFTETVPSILLSNLNQSFAEQTFAQNLVYIRGMHNVFLNAAAKKLELKMEEAYFELSDYNFTIASTATDKPDPKSLGFWTMPTRSGQTTSPTRINDMIDWVKNMAKYTEEEMEQQLYYNRSTPNGTERVKSAVMEAKYQYLKAYLDQRYQTDLHKLKPIF